MNEKKYKWILYTITAVIACTICIQVYWNYKNYQVNKQQLVNDVQGSLDKSIDEYYANLAERTTIGFAFKGETSDDIFKEGGEFQNIISQIDEVEKEFKNLDSLKLPPHSGITVLRGKKADSIFSEIEIHSGITKGDSVNKKLKRFHHPSKLEDIELLTSKIVISINNDTLVLKEVDSILQIELDRKKLNINYKLKFKNAQDSIKQFNQNKILTTANENILSTISRSTFLPKNSELKIEFTNETQIILRRILSGILISTLLVLAVISCLFYLLNIIKQQKQIAEVKNDLISNITHEFKTPIATIGVALESIKNFNVIDDKEKTKNYLDMSNDQLSKLNVMVEKLLETATLDSENLNLNKEEANITDLIHILVNKHQMQTDDKTIEFAPSKASIVAKIDVFHFENTINNILDNAIKYGGNSINISVSQNSFSFTVTISDNGKTLTKTNKEKIFDKFYRIPKGNTHDIKGFGIGLYYAKKITEKHGGAINLDLSNSLTTFKITLPNE